MVMGVVLIASSSQLLIMQGRKTIVRMISAFTALTVVLTYVTYSSYGNEGRLPAAKGREYLFRRHLLYSDNTDLLQEEGGGGGGGRVLVGESNSCDSQHGNDVDNANCSKPLHQGNDSCQFVKDQCSDDVALFNYLAFVVCDLPSVKVYILLLVTPHVSV